METKAVESAENNEIQDQPKAPETPIVEPKKYKLKLGETEEELAENDLAELVNAGRSAQMTRKEAEEIKQQIESLYKSLKENTRQALADPKLGIDLYKLAEETLLEKIQQDMLTPEQRKIKEYEDRFKVLEEKEKSEKQKRDQEALSQAETHWATEYDKIFHEALTSSGLPRTPRTIKRMAEVASIQLEQGRDVDAKTLAAVVREDYLSELKDLLGASDEDALLEILGDEISNKIRKADLKKLKSKPPQVNTVHPPQKRSKKSDGITMDEFRSRLDRIKMGLE